MSGNKLSFHGMEYRIVESKENEFYGEIFEDIWGTRVVAWKTYPFHSRDDAIRGTRAVIKRILKGQTSGAMESMTRLQKDVIAMCADPGFKDVVESLVRLYRGEVKKKKTI